MSKSGLIYSSPIDKCLISGKPVTKILDFGQHPYADTFVAENQLHMSEPVFPLQLHMNADSGSIQLGYISDATDRYNLYSYSYTSSNSATARKHWDSYAEEVKERLGPRRLVVEIGSNDGYLIKQFKSDDVQVLGIDSSETMCKIAEEQGVECINGLFDSTVAAQVRASKGPASVVMANNVFNHANDPVGFARGVAELLGDRGYFVFELPYWGAMIDSGRFVDMVYHEHVSYFTLKGAWNLLKEAGMQMVNYSIVDYHGGSIRVFATKGTTDEIPDHIHRAILREEQMGLFDPEFYSKLQVKFEQQRNAWLANFYTLKRNDPNAVIIGVGAAAKANTWLRWHGLDANSIDYVTDASTHKQGKYTPLSRIPIRGDEIFAQFENPYALILSWNISEPLKNALLKINPNIKFLSQ